MGSPGDAHKLHKETKEGGGGGGKTFYDFSHNASKIDNFGVTEGAST